ncbi:MAG: hypothetical protein WBE70_17900 [Candidatus Acidiferrum sp.]
MGGIDAEDTRRNGIILDGLIDGRENDLVACHVNDDTASRKIRDDFVATRTLLCK